MKLVVLILVLISIIFFSGQTLLAGEKILKVAIVFPGKIDDRSWNQAGYEGIMETKKSCNIELTYKENIKPSEVEEVLLDFSKEGYDLILAHGAEYGAPVKKVAKEYPHIKFGWAAGDWTSENLFNYDWKQYQASYLAGMLAAGMSKTGKIGAVGATDIDDVKNEINAYEFGAKAVNPNIQVLKIYLNYAWNDKSEGEKSSLSLIKEGADVIYCNGDTLAIGCIEACREKDVYAIGGIMDLNKLAPNKVITSTAIRTEKAFTDIFTDLRKGELKKDYNYDMMNNGVYLAPYYELEEKIPSDIKNIVEQSGGKILTGELQVPRINDK